MREPINIALHGISPKRHGPAVRADHPRRYVTRAHWARGGHFGRARMAVARPAAEPLGPQPEPPASRRKEPAGTGTQERRCAGEPHIKACGPGLADGANCTPRPASEFGRPGTPPAILSVDRILPRPITPRRRPRGASPARGAALDRAQMSTRLRGLRNVELGHGRHPAIKRVPTRDGDG